MANEQPTRTVLLKARCIDEWIDDVGVAVAHVQPGWISELLAKVKTVARLKAQEESLSGLTYWDPLDFYSSAVIDDDDIINRLDEDHLVIGAPDPGETCEFVRTDCVELVVTQNGVYWAGYLKHSTIQVETEYLSSEQLERLSGKLARL